MRQKPTSTIVVAAVVSLAACSSFREAMEGHQAAVARAGGYSLTIGKAAELVASSIPQSVAPDTRVVDRITDLWIGYTLLAIELASPDTFSDVDVAPIIGAAVTRTILRKLHDHVIMARVDSSDAVLRTAYEHEQPFVRVEVQHILINTTGATEAKIDSLARVAEAIRERAVAGEDFAQLARDHSQDPGSAHRGGYLGWVGHGRLLPEVEPTVLAMQPGEVSETVRSKLGYHIFKVTARESPEFESVRDYYRRVYVQRSIRELEKAYLDSVFGIRNVRVESGATNLVKRLAHSPELERLSAVRSTAVLARYRGGVLTVGEWVESVQGNAPISRQRFAVSDSATVHELLRQMVGDKLLIKVASDVGYTLSDEEYDRIVDHGHRKLEMAADQAGLRRQELLSAEDTIPSAVERAVRNADRNRGPAFALDHVWLALREGRTFQVYPDRFPAVVLEALAIRQAHGSGGESAAAVAELGREDGQ